MRVAFISLMTSNLRGFKENFFIRIVHRISIREDRLSRPRITKGRSESVGRSKPSGDGRVVKRGKGAIFIEEMNGKMVRKRKGRRFFRDLEISGMVGNRNNRRNNG